MCEVIYFLFVILRFILLAIAPAFSFVLFKAEWGCLSHGGRFPLSQQLSLPLNVLPLQVDSLLLPTTQEKSSVNIPVCRSDKMQTYVCAYLHADLMRVWKAYPSVHCSVKEAPCRTVVKWPRRRRSCMLLSLQAIFSCFD